MGLANSVFADRVPYRDARREGLYEALFVRHFSGPIGPNVELSLRLGSALFFLSESQGRVLFMALEKSSSLIVSSTQ